MSALDVLWRVRREGHEELAQTVVRLALAHADRATARRLITLALYDCDSAADLAKILPPDFDGTIVLDAIADGRADVPSLLPYLEQFGYSAWDTDRWVAWLAAYAGQSDYDALRAAAHLGRTNPFILRNYRQFSDASPLEFFGRFFFPEDGEPWLAFVRDALAGYRELGVAVPRDDVTAMMTSRRDIFVSDTGVQKHYGVNEQAVIDACVNLIRHGCY